MYNGIWNIAAYTVSIKGVRLWNEKWCECRNGEKKYEWTNDRPNDRDYTYDFRSIHMCGVQIVYSLYSKHDIFIVYTKLLLTNFRMHTHFFILKKKKWQKKSVMIHYNKVSAARRSKNNNHNLLSLAFNHCFFCCCWKFPFLLETIKTHTPPSMRHPRPH